MNSKKMFFTNFMFLLLFCGNFTNAQSIANYNTTRTTGISYNSIATTGLSFDGFRNTVSFTQDDNRSLFTDIGFDYWYNGIRYTQFSASTNGFLDFSNSADDGGPSADDFGFANTAFFQAASGNATRPAIAPFYDDLTTQGNSDPLGNGMKYLLTGIEPNRILTVEWVNMAVFGNTTPNLNFQIKLFESSGIIESNYGTMTTGTNTFTYTVGLNAPLVGAPILATQLKCLQTANSNTFNTTTQTNLNTLPTSNSNYTFTPPTPSVSGPNTLTFSAVTATSMTLNWTNVCTNEAGYVIYLSEDGINFDFSVQTAANTTTTNITGLLPSTNYFYRLFAVTEGALSAVTTGNQFTLVGINKISNQTGNWNDGLIWTPNGVPTAADNVTISNGHTVSINSNFNINSLIIGTGGAACLLQFTGASRAGIVNNTTTINSNGTFTINTSSNNVHTLNFKRNITNNGVIDFRPDANSLCNLTFNRPANFNYNGSGATNNLNLVAISLSTIVANTFTFNTPNIIAPANFLTLTNGIVRFSNTGTTNLTPFTAITAINRKSGIFITSTGVTINTQNSLNLTGIIRVDAGILNIGNTADEDLQSIGGTVFVNGGTINVAGKYFANGINNLCNFRIASGTFRVPSIGSTNTTISPFQIQSSGSSFFMTGGTIIIPREGGTGAQDLGYLNVNALAGSVTNGTLQIGEALTPATQTMRINTQVSVGNLLLNSANATAQIVNQNLAVQNNVTINTGILNANNFNVQIGGNWSNNGGTHIPGTNTTIFNNSTVQTIFGITGETFNNITLSGSNTKTLLSAITANGSILINGAVTLDVGTASNQISLKQNFTNNGTFNANNGLLLLNGTINQAIGGVSLTTFNNITLNNNAGAILNSNEDISNTLSLNNGTLNTNSKVFTFLSNAAKTARVSAITGTGDLTGNITLQRFAPGGTTGWANIGAPIASTLSLNDWDDDIYISCATCPDGSAAGFISIYTYNETDPGNRESAGSYTPMVDVNDVINNNKGYWIYLGDGQFSTNDITMDLTGSIRKFNNTIPLSYTNSGNPTEDGWNLIANPYPSPILWSALRNANANVEDGYQVYNADLNGGAGSFASFVNGISSPAYGSGGVSDTIAQGQAIYVHATAATSLTAQETNKVGSNASFLRMGTNQPFKINTTNGPLMRITLTGGLYVDETVLYYQNGATNGYDGNYDIGKGASQSFPAPPSIALLNAGTSYQINGISPVINNFSMDLKTTTGTSGSFTITANNIGSFPTGSCINLYDKFTNTTTDLTNSTYTFTLADSTTTARFTLNITVNNTLVINTTTSLATCTNPSTLLTASSANSGPWNYTWRDNNNNIIKSSLNKNTADSLITSISGNYSVDVNVVGTCLFNTSNYTVLSVSLPVANITTVDTFYLTGGTDSLLIVNNSTNTIANNWTWNNGGNLTSILNNSIFIPAIVSGFLQVKLIAISASGCQDSITKNVFVSPLLITAISNKVFEKSIKLLNTDNNIYTLISNIKSNNKTTVYIKDVSGKILFAKVSSTNTLNETLDLNNFEAGAYIIFVSNDKNLITFKVVKF